MDKTTATMEAEAPTTETQVIKKPRARALVMMTPRQDDVTGHKPIDIEIPVEKGCFSVNHIPPIDGRHSPEAVYHAYVRLSDWIGRTLPDGVNPRSHDVDCLKSDVAKGIEQTITESPEDFYLANRGMTIMAKSLEYDAKKGIMRLRITNPECQGSADGATTDAVISKVQTRVAWEMLNDRNATFVDFINSLENREQWEKLVPDYLKQARLHLEIHTDLEDRDRIASLVGGRNTSRQVKSWSMADFTGMFDWLKDILEKDEAFAGKIGWEENSGKDITVLDVLSIINLFHPEFDDQDANGDKAPTISYSNKGKMDTRLENEDILKGYTKLARVIPDILKLYEYAYSEFAIMFDKAYAGNGRLGGRNGVKPRTIELPFTGAKSNYEISDGYLFPLLASMRALVAHEPKIHWAAEPFEFLSKHGPKLIVELMEQVKAQGGGNPTVAGKRKLVYTALHAKAQLALTKELGKQQR